MSEPDSTRRTRREFLRGAGRGIAMASLAALAALLASREHDETCINNSICGGCAAFNGCGLPQALSRRYAMKRL